jgi:50S ribosomal protein L16 3-hydroxylase
MQRRVEILLRGIQWNRATTARFLGAFLSDPKPDVYFTPPAIKQSRPAFARAIARHGVTLDRRTQWLYDDDWIYLNGEPMEWPAGAQPALVALANTRTLTARQAASLSPAALQFLHDGYSHGFLHIA